MANYPQLDNASGVWNLREVYDAVMGGYWPNYNSIALSFHGFNGQKIIGKNIISTAQKTKSKLFCKAVKKNLSFNNLK